MRRVEDVLDCWFESGSMPFCQVHYPFENKEWFEAISQAISSSNMSARRAAGSTR
jgi:isoleucyl-tRNA synthetase